MPTAAHLAVAPKGATPILKEDLTMFCTNCGAQNADEAAFCTTCGNPLKANEAPAASEAPQAAAPPVPETPQPVPPPAPAAYTPPPQQTYAPPPAPVQQQAYAQPPQAYAPQQTPYQPQAAYGYPPQAPKKKKTGLIIGIGAGVLVLIIVLALVLTLGGGGKGGIAGKWTVVDTEGWSDYDEGMIFNFKGGTLTYEAPKGTPDEYKGMYELMNLLKTKYKTSGDKLTLTVSFFGQKEETVMRYEISGDTLKLYDGSDVTILKRTK